MQTQPQAPIRLASEDIIISAPMSYAGSAQRIMRLRRRADAGAPLAAITVASVVLVISAWGLIGLLIALRFFRWVPRAQSEPRTHRRAPGRTHEKHGSA